MWRRHNGKIPPSSVNAFRTASRVGESSLFPCTELPRQQRLPERHSGETSFRAELFLDPKIPNHDHVFKCLEECRQWGAAPGGSPVISTDAHIPAAAPGGIEPEDSWLHSHADQVRRTNDVQPCRNQRATLDPVPACKPKSLKSLLAAFFRKGAGCIGSLLARGAGWN
jgi:hypothetical protein